ncbi:DUF2252 domain-containing protein [Actinomycetaceae bacterium WB03_NA08]|uniref:DUF2252 domain-containing protein n=1 Tax=Scrofimicrobium canadense TaxID=2652290 RepID=A0A6N7VTV7_9ACTO|nr:DUF2252 domain-containing protein [Scrofimicrobium canadense]
MKTPVTTHVDEVLRGNIAGVFEDYRSTTSPDISLLLSTYSLTDIVRRVVGVGSVGTNCFLVALSSEEGDGLVLQVKEAMTSVVQDYSSPNLTTPGTLGRQDSPGKRVVDHQRILQAFSDPFLGFMSAQGRSYYVRQFQDSKGSFDLAAMNLNELDAYCRVCGAMLARAH